MLSVAQTTLGKLARPSRRQSPRFSPTRRSSPSLVASFSRSRTLPSSSITGSSLRATQALQWTRNYSTSNSESAAEEEKVKAPSYASGAIKGKPVPKSERVQWSPPVEVAKDPWKITTGSWYSPKLKARAVAAQIIERDFHLPEPTNSTPVSLPYPSSEQEERLLTEMLLKVDSTAPALFVSELLPYFDSLTYYRQVTSGKDLPPPVAAEKFALQLSSSFSVLQALPAPSSPTEPSQDNGASSFASLTPLWILLSYMDLYTDLPQLIKRIADNEKLADNHGEALHDRSSSNKAVQRPTATIDVSEEESKFLTPDQARILSETSEEHLKALLPALVEADVYYAAEVMNGVLKKKRQSAKLGKYATDLAADMSEEEVKLLEGAATASETRPFAFLKKSDEISPVLEISEILRSTLNPRQLTGLLPAMCRTNAQWREDGFFDLLVDVMSTGGVLRWEPEDVAAVIGALPKVPIAGDYFTPPELDPLSAENESKSADDLLKIAQSMAPTRWDAGAYGLPGDFYLRPSKEDVEAAKREFEEDMMETETAASTASSAPTKPFSSFNSAQDAEDQVNTAAGVARESQSSTSQSDKDSAEDALLSYLDVSADAAIVEDAPKSSTESASPPAFYNPIAWQPEEIGHLVGTMLSQELELDDIVGVVCTMATDLWEEEAGEAPWSAYMGYISSVVSEALTTNKHWVDEDYSWVLHDVIATVGPWALRKWPEYRVEEHQKWLAELVAQIAIKYGRFKHDYRFIQIALNMICDNWPDQEHQKLSDLVALRMQDRTIVGRTKNWYKWRISQEFNHKFSDQRAASSQLWIAPYNVGNNPKMPSFVQSAGLRDPGLIERLQRAITDTEDQKLSAPSRTGTKPENEWIW